MNSNDTPQLPLDTVLIERDGKFLFLSPSRPDWIVVNKNTAISLSLCDGSRTKDEIRNELSAVHPEVEDALKIIDTFYDNGFLSENPNINKSSNNTPKIYSVHLNLSRSCNLSCNYCYAEERPLGGDQLTFEEYKILIDDLRLMSDHIEVALTGGEPLLNKDACRIAEYCRSVGFYTHLLTNAIPINESNAQKIAKTFDIIRISIDGSTSFFHDFHRGEGTLDRTKNAIDLLLQHGANLKIAMTVTKHNIGDIEKMASIYGDILTFQPLFEAGNAKSIEDQSITGMEYFTALKDAKNVTVMGGIVKHLNRMRNRGTTKCVIGDGEISIGHNGDVYPCHMVHLPEFLAGNIREKNISDIYSSSEVIKSTRKLHIDARPECAECLVRLFCGGSCRARALYMAGDINACDDFCDYELSAYINGLFEEAQLKNINDFNSEQKHVCGDTCGVC